MSHNARNFLGTPSDSITFSLGSCGIPMGPGTAVAIVKREVDSIYSTIIHDTGFLWEFYIQSDNKLWLWNGTANRGTGDGAGSGTAFSVLNSDGWCLVAVSKASGTVAIQMAKYVWSTGTWTTFTDSATSGDSSSWATNVIMGRSGATAGSSLDIAAVAVYNTALDLTNAGIQTDLLTRGGWLAHTPRGMWELQQASTGTSVTDTTGNGANQSSISGTAVTTIGNEADSWFAEVDTPLAFTHQQTATNPFGGSPSSSPFVRS